MFIGPVLGKALNTMYLLTNKVDPKEQSEQVYPVCKINIISELSKNFNKYRGSC